MALDEIAVSIHYSIDCVLLVALLQQHFRRSQIWLPVDSRQICVLPGHMSNMPRFSSSCPMSTCSNLMSDFFSKHSLIASCNRSPTLLIHSGCSGRPCCFHDMPHMLRSCVYEANGIVLSAGGLNASIATVLGACNWTQAAMEARTKALIESLVPWGHSISSISMNSKAAGS